MESPLVSRTGATATGRREVYPLREKIDFLQLANDKHRVSAVPPQVGRAADSSPAELQR